jgi:hypothetical protein
MQRLVCTELMEMAASLAHLFTGVAVIETYSNVRSWERLRGRLPRPSATSLGDRLSAAGTREWVRSGLAAGCATADAALALGSIRARLAREVRARQNGTTEHEAVEPEPRLHQDLRGDGAARTG